MELTQWITQFEEKTGLQIMSDELLKQCVYDEEKGFAVFELQEDCVYIKFICGDGNYWRQKAEEFAKQNKKKKLKAVSVRNINAILKTFGFKKIRESQDVISCIDSHYRKVTAKILPNKLEDGRSVYEITQFLYRYGGDI